MSCFFVFVFSKQGRDTQYLIFFDGACPATFLIDANSFKSFNFSLGSIIRKSLKEIGHIERGISFQRVCLITSSEKWVKFSSHQTITITILLNCSYVVWLFKYRRPFWLAINVFIMHKLKKNMILFFCHYHYRCGIPTIPTTLPTMYQATASV